MTDGHVLGRDAACDTVLDGAEVSRRHARVELRGLLPILKDLESRNGIHVNGAHTLERAMGPGDVVKLGDWVGIVVPFDVQEPRRFELTEIHTGWYGSGTLSKVADAVRSVAGTRLPVVIEGETGTGKDGLARALHEWSGRTGAFVAVDCGALPEQLAEGALFGYRKGAFTGADRAHDGYFRAAHGGTLFLDEILNLPPALQPKLLRVLERGEIVPLGHSRPETVDVRVVCAAQEPLQTWVEDARFRADLLARVDGLTVVLPPLRERREDILPLFGRMLENHGARFPEGMETRCAEALVLYDWPLNVRELQRLAERVSALHGTEPLLRASLLPQRIAAPEARTESRAPARKRAPADDPEDFESLVAALRDHGGNLTRASKALGFTRTRAYRVLQAHPEFDAKPLRKSSEP